MNPVLADIYSTIIPSAPFIIAAYVAVWIVMLVYVVLVARRLKRDEAQIALLEEWTKHADEGNSKRDAEPSSKADDSH